MNPLTHILCGGVRTPAVAPGDQTVILDRRPDGNITLSCEQLRVPLAGPIPTALLDLLDIATYVYVADQAVRRTGDSGWRRSFRFRIPLREPERWADPAVAGDLANVLGFLSDDDYQFAFEPLVGPSHQRPSLPFATGSYDGVADSVALFSGGLDSLAGAAQLVADGKLPLLVTHRPCEKLAVRQERLLAGLAERAGGRWPIHLPVRVNKVEELGVEDTQRSRSFLFAALGGLVAAAVGLDRLLFFENGVVSLNLPPSGAVVGGRATRTTHPRVLDGFARLLTVATDRPFVVENPFRDLTKTEVVQALVATGGRDLIRWSTSCVHTRELSNEFPHCGRCSQCIDRRFAVLAAGAGADDPAEAYRVDLATGERAAEDAGLLAGYVEQATELGAMDDPLAFYARYGEAMRAVRAGPDSPAVAGRRIFDLHRRHAAQVNGVVEQVVRDHVVGIRTRILPPACLVRLVSDAGSVIHADDDADPPAAANVMRRAGEGWEVRFGGGEQLVFLPAKGFEYLHRLLARPNVPAEASSFTPERVRGNSGQTATDWEALADLRRRLEEAADDLARARADHDPARATEAEQELEALREQLRADTGKGGRLRRVADAQERQRKAVGNAITRARDKIAEFDAALAAHLTEPYLTLGTELVYRPPAGVVWRTD